MKNLRNRRNTRITASVQVAIRHMAQCLYGPEQLDPAPQWDNFVWFDEYSATDIKSVDMTKSLGYHSLSRKVYFYKDDQALAYVNMVGEQYPGSEERRWAAYGLFYRQTWPEVTGSAFHVPKQAEFFTPNGVLVAD